MKYVNVRMVSGNRRSKLFAFKTLINNLEKGEWVLVDTQFGPQVARVDGYVTSEELGFRPYKWLIERIDYSDKLNLLEGSVEL